MFLENIFLRKNTHSLVIGKTPGAVAREIFLGPPSFRAVAGDIELADIVILLFRGLLEQSLPFFHQLRDLPVEIADDGGDDEQHAKDDGNENRAGLIELGLHFPDQQPGVLRHYQIPRQFRDIAGDDEAFFSALGRGGRPELQARSIFPPVQEFPPDVLLMVELEPVFFFIPAVAGGDFDLAALADEACRYMVFFFIAPEQFFQGIDADADAHYAEHLAIRIFDLTIDEHRDFIVRAAHLIVVHVQGIVLGAVHQAEVPCVFRIVPVQNAVDALKGVIAPRGR